jgi:hypothetical protein
MGSNNYTTRVMIGTQRKTDLSFKLYKLSCLRKFGAMLMGK